MGLISNMFNYSKPGPGIEKEEQQKRRFFLFFELFFRKFWKLIQLNLLYILFWIPPLIAGTLLTPYNATLAYLAFFLVGTFTAGPATAGAIYILRNFATQTPVFLLSDFSSSLRKIINNQRWRFYLILLLCLPATLLICFTENT